ncbi:MAG: CRISPR-associated protein Csx3 [Nitrospinota bacterium]
MTKAIHVDLSNFYTDTAKLSELDTYIQKAKELAGEGNNIILTGAAPVWLYLAVAHALHGKARKLIYRSPVTGDVVIFDHSPD